jgi:DnaJ domain
MDYYEELGINPSATMDEIHKAHRRLSKLLHPDQQTDDTMKLLAETQMRRLNAIVGILSDPELRHQYDDQLKHAAIVPLAASGPRTIRRNDFNLHFGWERRRLLPWWIWTPLGAVVLTIGVVWFWADDVGSSFSTIEYFPGPDNPAKTYSSLAVFRLSAKHPHALWTGKSLDKTGDQLTHAKSSGRLKLSDRLRRRPLIEFPDPDIPKANWLARVAVRL